MHKMHGHTLLTLRLNPFAQYILTECDGSLCLTQRSLLVCRKYLESVVGDL